jgi:hypothetical protein
VDIIVVMLLIVGIPLVLAMGLALWLLLPTLRTFRGPAVEPTYTDRETILQVQQTFTPGTGGGS